MYIVGFDGDNVFAYDTLIKEIYHVDTRSLRVCWNN